MTTKLPTPKAGAPTLPMTITIEAAIQAILGFAWPNGLTEAGVISYFDRADWPRVRDELARLAKSGEVDTATDRTYYRRST